MQSFTKPNIAPKLIIFRFSSFGDVAMTVPVIKQVIEQNQEIEIIVVSNHKFSALFQNIPKVVFHGIDLKNYKGFFGLYRLFKELQKFNPTHLIDLHLVLRTKILKLFFKFTSCKIFELNKGRKEKKELIRKNDKKLVPLKSMFERYADVFRLAGFPVKLSNHKIELPNYITKIGIAPFARYKEKMFPLDRMKNIVLKLAEKNKQIFLFGGGKQEIELLNSWEKLHHNIISNAGKLMLNEELNEIKKLDVLISMDSANMHLASLVGVPCLSIWGATHYFAGFLGYNQAENNIVQSEVTCRPCSVFGNKKCFQNELKCMNEINDNQILEKLI